MLRPWHVPVLVTTALILSELVVYVAARSLKGVAVHRMAGVAALVLFTATAVVGVARFGPQRMNELAGVASAVLAAVAIWLAYESYRAGRSRTVEQPPGGHRPPATSPRDTSPQDHAAAESRRP